MENLNNVKFLLTQQNLKNVDLSYLLKLEDLEKIPTNILDILVDAVDEGIDISIIPVGVLKNTTYFTIKKFIKLISNGVISEFEKHNKDINLYDIRTLEAIISALEDDCTNVIPYVEYNERSEVVGVIATYIRYGLSIDLIKLIKPNYNVRAMYAAIPIYRNVDNYEKYLNVMDILDDDLADLIVKYDGKVDIRDYIMRGFSADQINVIADGIVNSKIDVSHYAKRGFTSTQMKLIENALHAGLDVKYLANPELLFVQMDKLYKGLYNGIDISRIANPRIKTDVMEILINAKIEGLNVDRLITYRYPYTFIKYMIDFIKNNPGKSYLMDNKNLSLEQLRLIFESVDMGLDYTALIGDGDYSLTEMEEIQNYLIKDKIKEL